MEPLKPIKIINTEHPLSNNTLDISTIPSSKYIQPATELNDTKQNISVNDFFTQQNQSNKSNIDEDKKNPFKLSPPSPHIETSSISELAKFGRWKKIIQLSEISQSLSLSSHCLTIVSLLRCSSLNPDYIVKAKKLFEEIDNLLTRDSDYHFSSCDSDLPDNESIFYLNMARCELPYYEKKDFNATITNLFSLIQSFQDPENNFYQALSSPNESNHFYDLIIWRLLHYTVMASQYETSLSLINKLHPTPKTLSFKFNLNLYSGDLLKAEKILEEIKRSNMDQIQIDIHQSCLYVSRNQFPESISLLESNLYNLSQSPTTSLSSNEYNIIYNNLAVCYLYNSQLHNAINLLEDFIHSYPHQIQPPIIHTLCSIYGLTINYQQKRQNLHDQLIPYLHDDFPHSVFMIES